MASLCSGLELQQERRLLGMFPQPVVKFILLYKASRHGSGSEALRLKTEQLKKFVILVYLKSGSVMGGFISQEFPSFTWSTKKEDADAFVFSLSPKDGGRFPVRDPSQALQYDKDTKTLSFGGSFKVTDSGNGWSVSLGSESDLVTHKDTGCAAESELCLDLEVLRVQDVGDALLQPWRDIPWTERNREDLRETLVSYKPSNEELTQARVLLLGPMGAGKSSFINSIRSVLYRHVVNLPIVGSGSAGFTKKLKSYPIRARKGGPVTALTLCDTMALGNSEWNGLTVHDALAVIKGHASDGHKFQPEAPIQPSTAGYRLDPSLKDKIHCVVFTLDARELTSYSRGLKETLRKLRSEISDLGTPQFVLLTHMDLVCTSGMRDIYTSRVVQAKMQEVAELAGMPLSFVLPVKNYASELAVDCDIDILLLGAVAQILQAIEDSLED